MEKTTRNIKRPMLIFASEHSTVRDIMFDRELYHQLRRDDIFDFGFRFCQRYCQDNDYLEKKARDEKIQPYGTKKDHFRKKHYHWIIHIDPESHCTYWHAFVKSISKYSRVSIISVPIRDLKIKHFIEALNVIRKKIIQT